MGQNLYMEDDDLRLYVDVQPLLIDELENSKNAASASAASAAQSELNARTWKNDIIDYKASIELFYAQSMNSLSDWYNTTSADLANLKNTCVQAIQNLANSVTVGMNTLYSQLSTNLQTIAQGYVNQAKYYAEQAQDTVDYHVSIEHLNQSKALLTGDVSDDEDVLNDITNYAYSTFCGYQVEGSTPGYLSDGVTPLDPKKFVKYGSGSIVTNDGILSNVDGNNYLYATISGYDYDISNHSYTIKARIKYHAPTGSPVVLFALPNFWLLYDKDTTRFSLMGGKQGGGNATFAYRTVSLNENDIVDIIVNFSATTINYSYRINNGSPVLVNGSGSPVLSVVSTLKLYTGKNAYGGSMSGIEMDLKYLDLEIDGVPVFSGNKTGIDTIKPVDYTTVTKLYAYVYDTHTIYAESSSAPTKLFNADGSKYTGSDFTISSNVVSYGANACTYTSGSNITLELENTTCDAGCKITDDGIASGFSNSNNIKTIKCSELKDKSWSISVLVNGNGGSTGNPISFSTGYTDSSSVGIYTNYAKTNIYLSLRTGQDSDIKQLANDNSYAMLGIAGDYINSPVVHTLSFDINTGTYTWTLRKADSETIYKTVTYTPTSANKQLTEILTSATAYVGIDTLTNYYYHNTLGSIDLNAFKIYVDGNLVYQPCLKIPYTESKTGSKIVNSIYRDRVNDMAEQFGYAPYYTLSDTDFTLPMGEIYGMIEKLRKLIIQRTS